MFIFTRKNIFLKIHPDIIYFLNQYFDKILVVSVPHFTDRHRRVEKRLHNLPIEFFWGVDKLELNQDILKKDGTYDEEKAKKLQRIKKTISLGELACALSHRNVYESIINNGWRRVLILEDDVWPLYENLQLLPQTIMELPGYWDLVYLGYVKNERVTIQLKMKKFYYNVLSRLGLMKWDSKMVSNLLPKYFGPHLKQAGFHDCSHAYAVTLEGAKKLLFAQTPVVYRADDLLSHTVLNGNFTAFITIPKFFDQENSHLDEMTSKIRDDH